MYNPRLGKRSSALEGDPGRLGSQYSLRYSAFTRTEPTGADEYIGCITKRFTFFKPKFDIDFNGWQVEGDFWGWDYSVVSPTGETVAVITKELFNWTDTYSIDVARPENALCALMLVLAIDAEKCSRNNG